MKIPVKWFLSVSYTHLKPEAAENKEAGIKILIPNGEFYASKVCDTFEDVYKRQLLRFGE